MEMRLTLARLLFLLDVDACEDKNAHLAFWWLISPVKKPARLLSSQKANFRCIKEASDSQMNLIFFKQLFLFVIDVICCPVSILLMIYTVISFIGLLGSPHRPKR